MIRGGLPAPWGVSSRPQTLCVLAMNKIHEPDTSELLKEINVLLVEDDPDMVNHIRVKLAGHVPNLLHAHSGSDALELFRSSHPDLIVTDIR
ncbi:MAG: hypothetical protein H7831_18225, partial [Magnetococcus sp. WYHC-3]